MDKEKHLNSKIPRSHAGNLEPWPARTNGNRSGSRDEDASGPPKKKRNSVTFKEEEHSKLMKLLQQDKKHSHSNGNGHRNGISSSIRTLFPPSSSSSSKGDSVSNPLFSRSKDIEVPRRGRLKASPKRFSSCVASTRTTIEEQLASKKKHAVWYLRVMTIMALIIAAIIVSALTFSYSRDAEVNQFEEIYYDSIIKVEEAITNSIKSKLDAASTFSALYTSRYSSDGIWPNTTMPTDEFNAQAVGLLEISNGIAISFNPIITNETRAEFEAHATESASVLGAKQFVERNCTTCRIVADGIYRKAPNPKGDGSLININDTGYSKESRYPYTMVPVWQIYPTKVNWRAVMFNLHSETNRQRALDDMLVYEVPTITALLHLVQHNEMNPSSILFYPVFDTFDYTGSQPRRIVGSISIVFTWEDMLRKVLPNYINGMIVVLESSVSDSLGRQLWTYDVSGEVVTLLGEGDLHDKRFDKYEQRMQTNVAKEAEDLGIVDFLITYKIRIYPSKELQNGYISAKPAILTVIVICVFILTSCIFGTYDYMVHFRQNAIISFANRSGSIVNSMFPASVRDRLFSHNETVTKQLKAETGFESESEHSRRKKFEKIRSFMNHNMGRRDDTPRQEQGRPGRRQSNASGGSSDTHLSTTMMLNNTPPIAEYFRATSVMFADIVGFTEWSSNHSPEEVFHLLETLYFEFDRIATRMHVFKLGTIGDCYVAVTGIPDQSPHHAIKLCQFTEECRLKMHEVFTRLEPSLDGVLELNMRFGIHSGPCTAGVLRGEKSRFELFGDTINTASRMESLSVPDMIQISQETANLLIEGGHKNVVIPRVSKVHAKGKGELQTYWYNAEGDFAMQDEARASLQKLKNESAPVADNDDDLSQSSSNSSEYALDVERNFGQ